MTLHTGRRRSQYVALYETEGLISGRRSAGGHRQYARDAACRIAFIRAAQAVGLALPDIRAALATLPDGRTPTKGRLVAPREGIGATV